MTTSQYDFTAFIGRVKDLSYRDMLSVAEQALTVTRENGVSGVSPLGSVGSALDNGHDLLTSHSSRPGIPSVAYNIISGPAA